MNEKILMGGADLPSVWIAENLRAAGLSGETVSKEEILASPERYRNTRYLFSTWGMPTFREDEIRSCLPSLRAVFYAAGSVRSFAAPFLDAGVAVFSAREILQSGSADPHRLCLTCGKCTALMRAGKTPGCVIYDKEIYGSLYRETFMKQDGGTKK